MPIVKKSYRFGGERKDILSQSEVAQMIDKANRNIIKCLISLLYLTGMRISEALELKRRDFNITKEALEIEAVIKKRKSMLVPRRLLVISRASPFVNNIITFIEDIDNDGYIFESPYKNDDGSSRPYSVRQMEREVEKLDSTVWLHLFRHTRATKLGNRGATAPELQTWFGWADIRPAKNYLISNPEMIKKLGKKLD